MFKGPVDLDGLLGYLFYISYFKDFFDFLGSFFFILPTMHWKKSLPCLFPSKTIAHSVFTFFILGFAHLSHKKDLYCCIWLVMAKNSSWDLLVQLINLFYPLKIQIGFGHKVCCRFVLHTGNIVIYCSRHACHYTIRYRVFYGYANDLFQNSRLKRITTLALRISIILSLFNITTIEI